MPLNVQKIGGFRTGERERGVDLGDLLIVEDFRPGGWIGDVLRPPLAGGFKRLEVMIGPPYSAANAIGAFCEPRTSRPGNAPVGSPSR